MMIWDTSPITSLSQLKWIRTPELDLQNRAYTYSNIVSMKSNQTDIIYHIHSQKGSIKIKQHKQTKQIMKMLSSVATIFAIYLAGAIGANAEETIVHVETEWDTLEEVCIVLMYFGVYVHIYKYISCAHYLLHYLICSSSAPSLYLCFSFAVLF